MYRTGCGAMVEGPTFRAVKDSIATTPVDSFTVMGGKCMKCGTKNYFEAQRKTWVIPPPDFVGT